MLQGLSRETLRSRTFRFGNPLHVGLYPDIEKLDARQIRELAEQLDCEKLLALDMFLSFSFDHPHPNGSRFTDGSFGVYYSALERVTAQVEAYDFYREIAVDGAKAGRIAYYRCISCQIEGSICDLRPVQAEMPFLTSDSGDQSCRQLAAEAKNLAVDGLLTPSAAAIRRSQSGTCLPVFRRGALSDPVDEGGKRFEFEPD